MGAWIETFTALSMAKLRLSHPVWVRGLKLSLRAAQAKQKFVAPRVGAWIETIFLRFLLPNPKCRTPCGCVD